MPVGRTGRYWAWRWILRLGKTVRSSLDCADNAILSFSGVAVPPGGFNVVELIDLNNFTLSHVSTAYMCCFNGCMI